MAEPILRVEGLVTQFGSGARAFRAVDGISFAVEPGKVLCIVGESGSGKSVTAKSILRLIEPPGRVVAGQVFYRDRELLALTEQEMERIRGDRISMVFQNPMTSLNPVFPVGEQVAEGVRIHQGLKPRAARARALELLALVGIPDAERRYANYPHEFSGGMRQRILIAGAIACKPDVLIADEPTTALDVTIQAQILRLLKQLQAEIDNALIMITHDLGVVAAIADDVLVMYAGRAVEYGTVDDIFHRPRHAYTKALLQSVKTLEEGGALVPLAAPTLLELPE